MTHYTLYGGGISRSAGVEAVLRELGLPYRLETVDITRGEHRSDAFRQISPAGLVPVLETPEGETLHETSGLMLHLADRHREAGLAPATDAPARGRFLTRFFYLVNEIEGPAKAVFYTHRIAPREEDVPVVRQRLIETLLKRWETCDAWLAEGGPWMLGPDMSIADILMVLWAGYGFESSDDVIGRFPAVRRCYEAVLDRDGAGPPIRAAHDLLRSMRASLPPD